MSNLFDGEMQKKILRNSGMSEEKIAKYVQEEKPVAKPMVESKKVVIQKKAAAKPVAKKQTLEEMKAAFKKEMERIINEAFDPAKPDEDPMAPPAGGDAGLPPAGDAGMPPMEGGDAGIPAEGEDLGIPPTDEAGLGMEGGDSESLKTEIKDKFSELSTKLGEEEKNAFANELMEILFPGSTTEISGEGGEGGLDAGMPPTGGDDAGLPPPAGDEGMPPMGDEDEDLEDDELL